MDMKSISDDCGRLLPALMYRYFSRTKCAKNQSLIKNISSDKLTQLISQSLRVQTININFLFILLFSHVKKGIKKKKKSNVVAVTGL